MMVMKRRFEDLRGKPLVDEDGWLTPESSVEGQSWSAVLAQAPFHLHSLCKDKPCVSTAVFLVLRDAVPTEANGINKFRKLLNDIHSFGPELLPGMPK